MSGELFLYLSNIFLQIDQNKLIANIQKGDQRIISNAEVLSFLHRFGFKQEQINYEACLEILDVLDTSFIIYYQIDIECRPIARNGVPIF